MNRETRNTKRLDLDRQLADTFVTLLRQGKSARAIAQEFHYSHVFVMKLVHKFYNVETITTYSKKEETK